MTRQFELNIAAQEVERAIAALGHARSHLNSAAFPGRYSMRLLIKDLKRLRDQIISSEEPLHEAPVGDPRSS
jgi:hypothetical protein